MKQKKKTTTKKGIETLHDFGKFNNKNAEAEVRTRVVGCLLHVWTFAVCLHQKSRDTTREV